MYRITNAEGFQLAAYANVSEVHTWLNMSVPASSKPANVVDANNFEYHDTTGNLIYRVSGPKPAEGAGILDTL